MLLCLILTLIIFFIDFILIIIRIGIFSIKQYSRYMILIKFLCLKWLLFLRSMRRYVYYSKQLLIEFLRTIIYGKYFWIWFFIRWLRKILILILLIQRFVMLFLRFRSWLGRFLRRILFCFGIWSWWMRRFFSYIFFLGLPQFLLIINIFLIYFHMYIFLFFYSLIFLFFN